MAEYTGVGLGVQTPDIMGKLSALLSIQAQKQALQGQAAEVAGAQQSQNQRAALANYMKFKLPQKTLEDGTIDFEGISTDPELLSAAGDKAPEVLQGIAAIKQYQVDAKRKVWELDETKRQGLAQVAGSLLADPDVAVGPDDPDAANKTVRGKQKLNEALEQYYESHGKDQSLVPAIAAYSHAFNNASPGGLRQVLSTMRASALTPDAQIGTQNPTMVSAGDRLTNINPNAAPTADIKTGIPPGFSIYTDPRTNNPYMYNEQTGEVRDFGSGAPVRERPKPRNSPGASPRESSIPEPYYPGQAKDVEGFQDEVGRIRAAADTVPQNRDIYKHILKLADDTNTGPLVSFFQNTSIGGQIFGDNYQELAKYLEKNAISQMQAMGGPPSDARLSAAVASNGSTKFNPQALKAVTQFNHAANTGLDWFRQGIDNAVGTSKPDYKELPRFKADWAKNFSIDVFRLENAIADGDEQAKAKILDGLSDKEASELLKKLDNLESLAKTGKLP